MIENIIYIKRSYDIISNNNMESTNNSETINSCKNKYNNNKVNARNKSS